jgi:acyl dehydratase
MKRRAPILHDPNPIHLDRAVVKAKGLGDRLINQGPINQGYIMNMLLAAFPGGYFEEFSNRFIDNVYEGDDLDASAVVTAVDRGPVTTRITCDFVLKAKERDAVITGKAVIAVPTANIDA